MNYSTLSLLIKRQFKEHYKTYVTGLLVLLVLLIFMFLVVHQWKDSFSGAVQNGVFVIGLFIAGGVFSNSMFGEFSSPQSGMWLLSIPAKASEKVVSSIVISTVFFLLVYVITFYVADFFYLLFAGSLKFESILNPFKNDFYQFFFIYLIFNGLMLLGSVIFNKNSLIKMLLAIAILFIILNYLNGLLLSLLIPEANIVSSITFDSFLFSHHGENVKVFLSDHINFYSALFVRIILPIALWVLVWLKLKEKEI
ncbi:hypothetical protein [Flagellimonas zhangzhouensis]|uniref:ABC-2 family transporter protein n=1 Tax=Flagellimonas zhangzhouensis TaxID=1073328 RepID=A0A1H2SIP7_9FLAO|nr:hypothetical protein [Allomuricauda zhangzhouensis]SDQ75291.1 hypothetical protein SAMN05216294_2471 [Allomuricauda zhangzhouensis]SDW31460.1 hypothetical protein SAMN04487892_1115 [Allomuricauda zhangzhouensis]